MGYPNNRWFLMETPINMDDLWVPPFQETKDPPFTSEWKFPVHFQRQKNPEMVGDNNREPCPLVNVYTTMENHHF